MVFNNILCSLAAQHVQYEQPVLVTAQKNESWREWINRKVNAVCLCILHKFSMLLAFFFIGYQKKVMEARNPNPLISQTFVANIEAKASPSLIESPKSIENPRKKSILLQSDDLYRQAEEAKKQKKFKEAKSLYQQAADLGHLPSLYCLGELSYQELQSLVIKHPVYKKFPLDNEMRALMDDAIKNYKLAANRDHIQSMYKLGLLLLGSGVCYGSEIAKEGGYYDQNQGNKLIKEGEEWLAKVVYNHNHIRASVALGSWHLNRGEEFTGKSDAERAKIEYSKALTMNNKAATKGNSDANNNLGWMYQNGLGCEIDLERAIKFYHEASKGGNAHALYRLGRMYELGHVTSPQKNKHIQLYLTAADQGCVEAMSTLGEKFLALAKEKNDIDSYRDSAEYFEKAAIKGHLPSIKKCVEVCQILADLETKETLKSKYADKVKHWSEV